jgi:hypothetical protein
MSDTKRFIFIEADYNDADYITEETEIKGNVLENLDLIKRIATAVKAKGLHRNWITGEQTDTPLTEQYPEFTEEELELFGDLVPYAEYGVNTIVKIEIREIRVMERLL